MRVVFVVSGDEEIRETAIMLRGQGNDVIYDDEVKTLAARTLLDGSYLVVAHGSEDGTVTIARSTRGRSRWLWVGMPDPPSKCRVYLYSCHAGRRLVPALDECEAFGHVHSVPVARSDNEDCVSRFLAKAAELVADEPYDRVAWQESLCAFLDEELQRADAEGPIGVFIAIHVLRRSLNFGKTMWE